LLLIAVLLRGWRISQGGPLDGPRTPKALALDRARGASRNMRELIEPYRWRFAQ
jgi:hypothetical protein